VDVQDWQRAHEAVVRVGQQRAELDAREARAIAEARRQRVHERLGYPSFTAYLGAVIGYDGRTARERVRVAVALSELPDMRAALEGAELSWTGVRELTRVAVPGTEAEWVDAARGKSTRIVQEMVSGLGPGQRPGDVPSEEARRHRLAFEVDGETLALLREAREELTRRVGHGVDDDAFVQALCRQLLCSEAEPGRLGYRVTLTVCQGCERGWQRGGGREVPVAADAVKRALSEGRVEPAAREGRTRDLPPESREEPRVAPEGRVEPRVAPAGRVEPRVAPAGRVEPRVAPAGRARDVGAEKERPKSRHIPAAVRRQVLDRHHGRCAVPGCPHSAFVHLHHTELVSEGGTHDPGLLCPLCSQHHAMAHDGRLVIRGDARSDFRFTHADGTVAGELPDAARADRLAQAFQCLCGAGFKQKEARAIIDRIRPTVSAEMTVEQAALAAFRAAPVSTAKRLREIRAPYRRTPMAAATPFHVRPTAQGHHPATPCAG